MGFKMPVIWSPSTFSIFSYFKLTNLNILTAIKLIKFIHPLRKYVWILHVKLLVVFFLLLLTCQFQLHFFIHLQVFQDINKLQCSCNIIWSEWMIVKFNQEKLEQWEVCVMYICTTSFTLQTAFYPQSVFMCSVLLSE